MAEKTYDVSKGELPEGWFEESREVRAGHVFATFSNGKRGKLTASWPVSVNG